MAVLIVAETALAVVLLVGAGLLLRSFLRLVVGRTRLRRRARPDVQHLAARHCVRQPPKRAALRSSRWSRGRDPPGVDAAGAIFGLPLTDFRYTISMSTLDGRRLSDDEQTARSLQVRVVTPDYFKAMGIPIVRGRRLDATDRLGAQLRSC